MCAGKMEQFLIRFVFLHILDTENVLTEVNNSTSQFTSVFSILEKIGKLREKTLFPSMIVKEHLRWVRAGHSLGAGVASLAATWAALQWPGADIRCVTFGNPKPGNQAYADVSWFFVHRPLRTRQQHSIHVAVFLGC